MLNSVYKRPCSHGPKKFLLLENKDFCEPTAKITNSSFHAKFLIFFACHPYLLNQEFSKIENMKKKLIARSKTP